MFRPVLPDANALWKGETVDEATDMGTIYFGSSIGSNLQVRGEDIR